MQILDLETDDMNANGKKEKKKSFFCPQMKGEEKKAGQVIVPIH